MRPEEMDRLIEEHLAAEKAGDTVRAVSMYTEDVEHDVVARLGLQRRSREVGRADQVDRESCVLDGALHRVADERVILHDQHSHCSVPS